MKNVILDLDTGIDDTLALLYVLAKKDEIKLLGVTSVFGNVETLQSARNSLNILDFFNRNDVDVYLGSKGPYGQGNYEVKEYLYNIHGKNGVGNIIFPTSKREVKKDGVKFIRDMIISHPGNITIVPTGPLTNLAHLYEIYPEVLNIKHEVISMGGALTVEGNVTPHSEANYYKDPISAAKVFSKPINFKMIGLDVTTRSHLKLEEVLKWNGEKGKLIQDMASFYIAYHKKGYSFLHDPSAVCAILHPEFFKFLSPPMYITEDGRSIGKYDENIPLKQVAVDVDSISVERELINTWNTLFQ